MKTEKLLETILEAITKIHQAAPVKLTPVQASVQAKLAMAGPSMNVEFTLEEFACWSGRSRRWIREHWRGLPGAMEPARGCRAIHLGTYVDKALKAAI